MIEITKLKLFLAMKYLIISFAGLLFAVNLFSQTSWSLTGNAGTTNSNWLGTTDNRPLIFRANNQIAGYTGYADKGNVSFGFNSFIFVLSASGNDNTVMGAQALQWNTGASRNVAMGRFALENCLQGDNNVAVGLGALGGSNTPGTGCVAIGSLALRNNAQSFNTAVGFEAGINNLSGQGITAVGFKALWHNTTGEFNTALGHNALLWNTTGYWNVALGSGSLQSNSTGRFNTAGGNSSMWFNETGIENTAFGEQALGGNIDGSYNTAVGCRSLWSVVHNTDKGDDGYGHGIANTALGYESIKNITNGNWNLGVGVRALETNSSGCNNVAIGGNALSANTTGSQNTAVGHNANVSEGNFTNTTAIGYGAVATASNQIMLGNSNVTSIRSYASLTTISDGRIKKDVQANIPGLIFINKLQPVSYHLDFEAMQQLHVASDGPEGDRSITGFIAQDVETAAKSVGFDFSGIDIDNAESHLYGLRYSKFVVPLVKAVQELSDQNDALSATIALLQSQVEMLTNSVNKLLGGNNSIAIIETPIVGASLGQNYPNPSNQSTTIEYTLPQNCSFAKIFITDTSGKMLKQQSVSGYGENKITIDTYSLPQGTYYYSLYVDNMPVSTKKMIIKR